MSLHDFCDDTGRNPRNIRSVGFLDECEDALDVIRAAKLRAQHAMEREMERLRDVLEAQHERIVGGRSEDSWIRWEKDCKDIGINIETEVDELCFWTEHEIRAEKESY